MDAWIIFTVLSMAKLPKKSEVILNKIFHSIKTKINAAAETHYGYFHAHITSVSETHQQPVGAVDGDASGEGVMNGQVFHISWRVVASLLIHIPVHMEVDWVVTHGLLPHVFKLHPFHMHRAETSLRLKNKT